MLPSQDFNKIIDNYSYNINNVLGKGAFSTVYLGKYLTTGESVAIKVVNLTGMTPETYQKLQYELTILRTLPCHPNIVKVHNQLQTVNNVYIVTEHCDRRLKNIPNQDLVPVALGIIDGLKHLYVHNIVHRDLKPDNVLIKNGVPKIIDFGFAKILIGPSEVMNEHLGTPLFMSPQLLDSSLYTSKCDIWSLGVLLHELLFRTDPYGAQDFEDLKRKIKLCVPAVFSVEHSNPLSKLIQGCLVIDENSRISW